MAYHDVILSCSYISARDFIKYFIKDVKFYFKKIFNVITNHLLII